ncbi:SGNH/GDSL hydrolase family protein [Sedimentitalea sp.]|uniref:SGNH/GDSL hydrolase family protein n=1 Tax=Sedimentitalea sp. TaxID=2048915 RepID=UPI003299291C
MAKVVDMNALTSPGMAQLEATVIGRVAGIAAADDNRKQGFRHQWPAVYASARFSGDAILLAFNDAINRYRLTLGETDEPVLLITQPGKNAVQITGLGPGPHHVRLDKISESLSGTGDFFGFVVPAGGKALAPPDRKMRQIEVIGDSDAVGYGNASSSRDCVGDEVFFLTDTQEAFGPRVARSFDADYQIIAVSGIGLVRNYGGVNSDTTMIDLYPRLLIDEPAPFQSDGWNPQVVVFALGSNDFATPLGPDEAWLNQQALRMDFETRYVRFIETVRAQYPQALFILVAMEDYGADYLEAHRKVLTGLQSGGNENVAMVVLPKMEKTGCHWHPSDRDHQILAGEIANFLDEQPGVWGD